MELDSDDQSLNISMQKMSVMRLNESLMQNSIREEIKEDENDENQSENNVDPVILSDYSSNLSNNELFTNLELKKSGNEISPSPSLNVR